MSINICIACKGSGMRPVDPFKAYDQWIDEDLCSTCLGTGQERNV